MALRDLAGGGVRGDAETGFVRHGQALAQQIAQQRVVDAGPVELETARVEYAVHQQGLRTRFAARAQLTATRLPAADDRRSTRPA